MKKILVGGTHGNEWTGIYLLDYFGQRSSFQDCLLANPKAFEENKRYVDEDLNRCFSAEKLENPGLIYERQRASDVLNKVKDYDLVLDLHTTTSNMGATVIFCDHNPEIYSLLSFISQSLPDTKFLYNPDPYSQYLISNSRIGLVVEVGPVANSTLNPIVFELSKAIANVVAQWDNSNQLEERIEYYEYVRTIDYIYNESNKLCSMLNPEFQNRDFCELKDKEALLMDFDAKPIYFDGLEGLKPVFINEAAYYAYEYAMQLVEQKAWTLEK